MSGTQMIPNLWGSSPWFNVHKDRKGASTAAAALSSTSWLVGWLGLMAYQPLLVI